MKTIKYIDLVGKDEISLPYVGKAVRASSSDNNAFWVARGKNEKERSESYGLFMIDNGKAPRLLEKFSDNDDDCYKVLKNIYNRRNKL